MGVTSRPMSESDPLLSVAQVARIYGTGIPAVLGLIEGGALPSLDFGELIEKGHLDVPLIRRSWAQALQFDAAGSDRLIEPPEGEQVHPAFVTAFDVHSALDKHDAETLYEISSKASRVDHDRDSLLARWMEINEGGYPSNSGVGSSIYSLAPLPAVAAQVLADAPRIPRAVTGPAPVQLLAVLPLVEEEGDWKVDLPLYEGPVYLPELLATPLPEDEAPPG